MTTDLDKLEKVAKAATPGPWEASQAYCSEYDTWTRAVYYYPSENYCVEVIETGCDCGDEVVGPVDTKFIAQANPSTVLELIERVRDYENVIREFAMQGMDVETLEHAAQVMEKWNNG